MSDELGAQVFSQRTLNHRRTVVGLTTFVLAVHFLPGLQWGNAAVFGVSPESNTKLAALVFAWAVLIYSTLNFAAFAYHDTRNWLELHVDNRFDRFLEVRNYLGFKPSRQATETYKKSWGRDGDLFTPKSEIERRGHEIVASLLGIRNGEVQRRAEYKVPVTAVRRFRRVFYQHMFFDYGVPVVFLAVAAVATDWSAMLQHAYELSIFNQTKPYTLPHRPC